MPNRFKSFLVGLALCVPHLGYKKQEPKTTDLIRASYYAPSFEGKKMANGKPYRSQNLTAASRVFPLGSVVKVTNKRLDKSVYLEITDTGPWVNKFGLDLSEHAFTLLGFHKSQGWGWVEVTRVK